MTKERNNPLSLDRPATYQIKLPGKIDISRTDWAGGLEVTNISEGIDPPATILTGEFDQAALHGLLHRIYSMGLQLISVIWLEGGSAYIDKPK